VIRLKIRRLRRAVRRMFCRHQRLQVKTFGDARFSSAGDVAITCEITCERCRDFWHAQIDARDALQRGMKSE